MTDWFYKHEARAGSVLSCWPTPKSFVWYFTKSLNVKCGILQMYLPGVGSDITRFVCVGRDCCAS